MRGTVNQVVTAASSGCLCMYSRAACDEWRNTENLVCVGICCGMLWYAVVMNYAAECRTQSGKLESQRH